MHKIPTHTTMYVINAPRARQGKMNKLQLNQKIYSMAFDTTGPENDATIADVLNIPVETIGLITYNTSKMSDGCYCYFVSTVQKLEYNPAGDFDVI